MTWKCENCGEEITEEEMKEKIEDQDASLEDVSEVILVDCDNCKDEVASYEKNNATGSTEPDNTTTNTRSKMLQAARS